MAPADTETKPSPKTVAPLIVNLGKKRRKLVRQLLEGEGQLLDEVEDAINELKASGAISATAQPVIVVVRPKPKARNWLFPLSQ
jgi:Family of unknown function (DUF6200)